MSIPWRRFVVAIASTIVWTGCGTGPPGAGVTNPEPPLIGGPEKAAVRDDIPPGPGGPTGDAPLAEAAASKPADVDTAAGTKTAPATPEAKSPASPGGSKGQEGSAKP